MDTDSASLCRHRRPFEIYPLLRTFLEEKFRGWPERTAPACVELVAQSHLGRQEWDDAFSIVEHFFDAELLVHVVELALPHAPVEARLATAARWVECAAENEVDAPVMIWPRANWRSGRAR